MMFAESVWLANRVPDPPDPLGLDLDVVTAPTRGRGQQRPSPDEGGAEPIYTAWILYIGGVFRHTCEHGSQAGS